MYRRQYGEAYYDAGTAKINFYSPVLALEYLIERSGSAYFSGYMATADIAAGRLFALSKASVFHREVFAISQQVTA